VGQDSTGADNRADQPAHRHGPQRWPGVARRVRFASPRHRQPALNNSAVNNGIERTITLKDTGIEHDVEIRTGHVSQEIVDFAQKNHFDLIVLGSKGRSAIADLLLGSVAQRVLATAVQPVLLVK
jgi:hypothetical protein